jgi:hypothetical protein
MYSIEIKNNKEIYDFCMVNGITDINKFIQDCFKQGFDIKRYGFLGETEYVEKIVEVIKEVPGPPVEIEVIKYVDREVIKEVPVEKIVSKIEYIYDKKEGDVVPNLDNICDENKVKMLETTLLNLRKDLKLKNEKINELENKLKNIETNNQTGAVYMRSSNIIEKL